VGPTFPTSVTVGQTGIAASITITNNNTPPEIASTVCRHDDLSTGPLGECAGAEGIVLTPSCGVQSVQFVVCTAPGADPNVFLINPSATGSGACLGVAFTAVPLNDAFGRYRFDPPSGVHVVLPTPGSVCTIDFTFDVLRMPAVDRQSGVTGIQTAQIALASVQADTGNLGAGQGSQTGLTVLQAVPAIVTDASAGFVVGGGQLSDSADVTGLVGATPGSTVTFRLYGPSDPTCSGTPVFTDTQPLSIGADPTAGSAQSQVFTPADAGTYRWVATYDGDVNNAAVSGTCGDPTESRVVSQATPSIATLASPDTALGVGQLSDQATVTGLVSQVGPQTVTFDLFGPSDPACAGTPIFTSTVPLSNGVAVSASFTPVDVGTYRWVATYDGDVNNVSVSGSCGDPTESRDVSQATPSIATVASPDTALGVGQLSDQATVTGVVNPVGPQTVTFDLFGPSDPTCAGTPISTSTVRWPMVSLSRRP
jgi:hypothetical protein